MTDAATTFTRFVEENEPRIRAAMIARFGRERGADATSDALAYGWENWERIQPMENPAGYLYRVAQHSGGRMRSRPVFPDPPHQSEPLVEPGLPAALSRLSDNQRMAVMLVMAFGWTQHETAEFLGVSDSTVRNHLRRGLSKLRTALGVTIHA
jgi:DNA-directed RNA polymerase specialized sigma24 family protein